MKTLPQIALALALVLGTALPAAAQEESIPPTGRSLFDFLVTKKVGESYVYDVPFPFDKLVEEITRKAHGGQSSSQMTYPSMALIPNGRSLQKDFANLSGPRTVLAFSEHPSRSHDVGLLLRDRLFIGYAPKANQLEVISYNELDGRYEFQVVSDYKAGGKREVQYASRQFCTECHKLGMPIFSKNTWDETNANLGVANALLAAHDNEQTLHGIVRVRGSKGTSYSIDTSTDRAARLPKMMQLWKQGCKSVDGIQGLPAGFKGNDCRAHIVLFGLAASAGIEPAELGQTEGGYTFVGFDKIVEIWRKNLGEADLKIAQGDLENRNPSGFEDSQLQLITQERDRIALWTKNMQENRVIDQAHDPKTTPVAQYRYVEGVDSVRQALDLAVGMVSGLITPSERKALPTDAAQFRSKIQAAVGKLLKDGAAGDQPNGVFAEKPLAKGRLMKALFEAAGVTQLGGQAIASSCCDNVSNLPPVRVSGGETFESTALALFGQYCGENCHAVFTEPAQLGFLVREQGMTDRELFIKMVKLQKAEPCLRMDWGRPTAQLPVNQRMPMAPHRQNFEQAEAQTGVSRRRDLIDAYKTELLSFADDPAAQAALGMTAETLRSYADTCKWNGGNGNGGGGGGGGNNGGGGGGGNNGGGGGGGSALAGPAREALVKHCGACHSGSRNDGGINYINDLAKLVEKKKVRRGAEADRAKSRVLVRILDEDSPMPPAEGDDGQPLPRMTAAEIKAVRDWVMADAPL